MFPWHSTVVGGPRRLEERWDPAATLASASSPVDQSKTSAERIFDNAYRAMVDAGKDVEREVTGKIKDTAPMLRAIAREGVRLGPQGAGILLALADRIPVRPPTKQEFMHCCVQPGTEVTGPEPAPGPSGRGRGLGHVFGQSAKGSGPPSKGAASRGRGRGGLPQQLQQSAAAGRGRGRGAGAAGPRMVQVQGAASMRASSGR